MRNPRSLLIVWFLASTAALLPGRPARAQAGGAGPRDGFQGGFHVGALYSSLSDPTFRFPSGTGQLSVSQSKSMPALVAGYDIGSGYAGFGVRGIYFGTDFQSFATPEMPGGLEIVRYADPKYTVFMVDLLLHWAPARSRIFSAYGFLGLGTSAKKYTISDSVFPEWNGAKSLGVRVQLRPRPPSPAGEARLRLCRGSPHPGRPDHRGKELPLQRWHVRLLRVRTRLHVALH